MHGRQICVRCLSRQFEKIYFVFSSRLCYAENMKKQERRGNMKKVVSLLLLAVLCLGLCACENSGGASLGTAVWEKAYYLDAFNDPTEEYYIGTAQRLRGSYSSESVTDGKLEA